MESVSVVVPKEKLKKGPKKKLISKICDIEWILCKKPIQLSNSKANLSIIDLYSGCGGMTLGICEALKAQNYSIDIRLALDVNQAALEVYKKNFKVDDERALNIDITKLVSNTVGEVLSANEKKLQKRFPNVDILVAGPPCQGHSNLNNHTRRNDPRNNLYLNAIRFIEIVKPKVAIIENVSTVIHDKDKVVEKAGFTLQKNGYRIHSIIIDASKFGLAQTRKRHFQIALLNSNIEIDLEAFEVEKPMALADYIGDIINEHQIKEGIYFTPSETKNINKQRIEYLFDNALYDLPDEVRPNCHKTKNHSYKSCYGRMYWDKPAQTITSGFGSMGQGRYIHPLQKRVITPHEAARIQGFPDFFDFSKVNLRGELHTMIANAVPPKVIAIIITSLLKEKMFENGKK